MPGAWHVAALVECGTETAFKQLHSGWDISYMPLEYATVCQRPHEYGAVRAALSVGTHGVLYSSCCALKQALLRVVTHGVWYSSSCALNTSTVVQVHTYTVVQ